MSTRRPSLDARRPSVDLPMPQVLQYAPKGRRRPSLEEAVARGPQPLDRGRRRPSADFGRRPSLNSSLNSSDGGSPKVSEHRRRPSADFGRRPSLNSRRPSLDGGRPSLDARRPSFDASTQSTSSAVFGAAGLRQMVDVYEGGGMRRRCSLVSNTSVTSANSAASGNSNASTTDHLRDFGASRSVNSSLSIQDWAMGRSSKDPSKSQHSGGSRLNSRRPSQSSTVSAQSLASLVAMMSQKRTEGSPYSSQNSSIWAALSGKLAQYFRKGFADDVRKALHSTAVQTFMFLLSFFTLFGDDIRTGVFDKNADPVFNVITIVSLAIFTLEVLTASCVVHDYVLSFFFWLDVIATVSLVLDITFVWDEIVGYQSFTSSAESFNEQEDSALGQSEYARAGRSSRVGTRIARILRVIRLVRVVRVFKFRPWAKKEERANKIMPGEAAGAEGSVSRESRVGQKLSERTTAWVIVLVITMLIMIPLLDPGDTEMMMLTSAQYGADVIQQAWQDYLLADAGQTMRSANVHELRLQWERQVLLYVYYHNFHASCPTGLGNDIRCASDVLFKLCYLGFVQSDGIAAPALQNIRLHQAAWNGLFPGSSDGLDLRFHMGDLPGFLRERLTSLWTTGCGESERVYGVSMMQEVPCPWKHLRLQEISWYFPQNSRNGRGNERLVFFFDIRDAMMWQAIMGMLQTFFIIIVLTVGALFFSKDADKLVLAPIEGMISKVETIRKDPLYAIRLGEEKYRQQIEKRERKAARSRRSSLLRFGERVSLSINSGRSTRASSSWQFDHRLSGDDRRRSRLRAAAAAAATKKPGTLETKILENTIIQLGSLLALGFGQAGTEIIGKNLDDDVNSTVNVMIPGRTVEAIYGYCQIKNFAVTTEVLQQKTMVFVNQVADIVHRTIDEHLGSANKNVGEAFLLVWRLDAFEASTQKLADLSVLSFIQVIVAVNRDHDLANYREHPALLARLGSYRVGLGFGLHIGWSIEGAIGSEFKIDASYLSTHVNLAMRLEAVSACYGVPMLMTEPLVRSCSPQFLYQFRAIDNVKLEGQKNPFRLFTVDLDTDALFVDHSAKMRVDKTNRFIEWRDREERKQAKLEDSFEPMDFFNEDRHIRRMRAIYFLEFFQDFEKGFLNYEAGEWDVAARVFGKTAKMLKNRSWHSDPIDGPSRALLEFMVSYNYKAPSGWRGFRELSEKDTFGFHRNIEELYVAQL